MASGVMNSQFDFSYRNRENDAMFVDLGQSLVQMQKITPGGILIFFPSYLLMKKCYDQWDQDGIIDEMDKKVFKEP